MAAVCPDAWLLNYTNPMAMLCWATYAGTPAEADRRPLPLGPEHDRASSPSSSTSPSRRSPSSAPASTTRRSSSASSATARTSTRCSTRRSTRDPELLRRVRIQMYRRLRLLPDRVERALGRVPPLVHARRRGDRAATGSGRPSTSTASEENLAEYERTRELLAAGAPLPIEPSNEYAPQIIHSIETGTPRVIYGNVANTGLIENLPAGRLRRGALPGRRRRRAADLRSASCRRSWRRSTGPSSTSPSSPCAPRSRAARSTSDRR